MYMTEVKVHDATGNRDEGHHHGNSITNKGATLLGRDKYENVAVQWNQSIADFLGIAESVLISEVCVLISGRGIWCMS